MYDKLKVPVDTKEHEYDILCKNVLSHKSVMAYILNSVVREFHHLEIHDVLSYLHHQDSVANRFLAGDKEDCTLHHGSIRFDMFFSTKDPLGRKGILFDVEAQHRRPSKYDLKDRCQYYNSRMIASQKNVTFTNSNYSDLYKAVSLWIIQKPLKKHRNKIYSYRYDQESQPSMDLTNIIIINLGGPGKGYQGICRVLDILLSHTKSTEEKIKVLQQATGLPIKESIKEELDRMCNFAEGLYKDAKREGKLEGRREGKLEGIAVGKKQGERLVQMKMFKKLIQDCHMNPEEVFQLLEIPEQERQLFAIS